MANLHPPTSIATNVGNTYSYTDFIPSNSSEILTAFGSATKVGYYQSNLPDGYVLNSPYEVYASTIGGSSNVTTSYQPNTGDPTVLTNNTAWSSAIFSRIDPIQFFSIYGYHSKTSLDSTLNKWQGHLIKPYGSDIGYIFAYTNVSISGLSTDVYSYFIMGVTDGVDIYPWLIYKYSVGNDATYAAIMADPLRSRTEYIYLYQYSRSYGTGTAPGAYTSINYNGYTASLTFDCPTAANVVNRTALPSIPLSNKVTTSYMGTGTPTATTTSTSGTTTTTTICSIVSTQNNTSTQPPSAPSNPTPTPDPDPSTGVIPPSSPVVSSQTITTYRGFTGTTPTNGVYPSFNGLDPRQSYQPTLLSDTHPWEGFACLDFTSGSATLIPVDQYTGDVTALTPILYVDMNGNVLWPKSVIDTQAALSVGRMYYLVKVTGGKWEMHLDGGTYPSNTSILYLGLAISNTQFLFNAGKGYLGTSYVPPG